MIPASAPPRVAIMQPTFLPWVGYFALMAAVDVFVYLDDVQLSRQSWQTRNRIKGPQGEVMLSLPVARQPSRPLIREAALEDRGQLAKLGRTLSQALARAPHADLALSVWEAALPAAPAGLSAFNIALIEGVAAAAGIATRRVTSSALGLPPSDRAGRLIEICRAFGAGCYVSPPGALDYLAAEDPFEGTEVDLRFFAFDPPPYPQGRGAFLPYMAALDALAWTGGGGLAAMLRDGLRPEETKQALLARRAG